MMSEMSRSRVHTRQFDTFVEVGRNDSFELFGFAAFELLGQALCVDGAAENW